MHLKRVVWRLCATGGLPTPFWFAIEESDGKGELHCHGEIVFCPEREKAVRIALKRVGGQLERDGTQLRFSKVAPDFRWAGYCLKSVHKARPERRRYMRQFGSPRRWVAGFEGKSVTTSEGLKNLAVSCTPKRFKQRLGPELAHINYWRSYDRPSPEQDR